VAGSCTQNDEKGGPSSVPLWPSVEHEMGYTMASLDRVNDQHKEERLRIFHVSVGLVAFVCYLGVWGR
jgi:hypothetical protein